MRRWLTSKVEVPMWAWCGMCAVFGSWLVLVAVEVAR